MSSIPISWTKNNQNINSGLFFHCRTSGWCWQLGYETPGYGQFRNTNVKPQKWHDNHCGSVVLFNREVACKLYTFCTNNYDLSRPETIRLTSVKSLIPIDYAGNENPWKSFKWTPKVTSPGKCWYHCRMIIRERFLSEWRDVNFREMTPILPHSIWRLIKGGAA